MAEQPSKSASKFDKNPFQRAGEGLLNAVRAKLDGSTPQSKIDAIFDQKRRAFLENLLIVINRDAGTDPERIGTSRAGSNPVAKELYINPNFYQFYNEFSKMRRICIFIFSNLTVNWAGADPNVPFSEYSLRPVHRVLDTFLTFLEGKVDDSDLTNPVERQRLLEHIKSFKQTVLPIVEAKKIEAENLNQVRNEPNLLQIAQFYAEIYEQLADVGKKLNMAAEQWLGTPSQST